MKRADHASTKTDATATATANRSKKTNSLKTKHPLEAEPRTPPQPERPEVTLGYYESLTRAGVPSCSRSNPNVRAVNLDVEVAITAL